MDATEFAFLQALAWSRFIPLSFPPRRSFLVSFPLFFSFGNEDSRSFVIFRSFRRNRAGSQIPSEPAVPPKESEHFVCLQTSCLCLAPQCFAR